MAEGVENSSDFDMFSRLQTDNEVQTTAASMNEKSSVVAKLLHPPSAIPSFHGLPTNDTRSQVTLEYRNIMLQQTPFVQSTGGNVAAVTPASLTTYRYAMLVPNGARVLGVPFIYNNAFNSMSQDLNNVQTQDNYNFTNWPADAQLYRPCYKSLTTYLNATAFNDTGIVTVNQFNPSLIFAGPLINMSHDKPDLFDLHVKEGLKTGRYKILPNEPIRDGFTEISRVQSLPKNWAAFKKSVRDDLCERLNIPPNHHITLDPSSLFQVLNLGESGDSIGSPVPTDSQVLTQSMRSYAGKAMEGTFSVSRLNTTSPAWKVCSNGNGNPNIGLIPELFGCQIYSVAPDGSQHLISLSENAAVGTTQAGLRVLSDTLWTTDMTWHWVIYNGLSLNSQVNVQLQNVIFKWYTGFEVQPALKSAWAGMVKLAPKPDLAVMQAIMDANFELKDGMPARYNFWGALGTIAARGIQTFGSSILKELAGSMMGKGKKGQKKKQLPKASTIIAKGVEAVGEAVAPTVKRVNKKEKVLQNEIEQLRKELQSLKTKGKKTAPPTPKPRKSKGKGVPLAEYTKGKI